MLTYYLFITEHVGKFNVAMTTLINSLEKLLGLGSWFGSLSVLLV